MEDFGWDNLLFALSEGDLSRRSDIRSVDLATFLEWDLIRRWNIKNKEK